MQLNQTQVNDFTQNGFLVIQGFYDPSDVETVQKGIYAIIGAVMARHGMTDARPAFSAQTFDAGYMDLIRANRSWGGEVYDLVKEIPAFNRLIAHATHEDLMRQLRTGAVPGLAAGGSGIRIDNPNEDKFRAMWHQEYPAQLKSPDGLVFWSPLVEVTPDLGPVMFCPGSQREGPLAVCHADPENAGRSGAYALKLAGEDDVLSRYEQVAPLSKPGDLVVLDFLLLHASGYNRSDKPRWSMQFRYYNLANPTGQSHGWTGSFAAGVDFRTVHPELFVETVND
ncbi:Phytanoyl-CoA dioxygenase (PhyH) [Hoeflea sp. IMCC20628]|uniref:phytanoyl-CoA dioxygenase family protein n=1 Tax=Hoeflea sp. IMCC20628 TaxID=1620421 RepID=UPI00063A8E2F|nr:phytanoyl-CoA dioxygenase family protein [Hoeflea sp. IMCC20628]AKI02042.1 Phytanoyl-CoA dioxygenase (PhyH) [Hoeflea sp. IMCC20628]